MASLHYLAKITLQKSHRLKAQQRQTRGAHNEENVTTVGELAISQKDQLQIFCLNTLNSTVWGRTNHFITVTMV